MQYIKYANAYIILTQESYDELNYRTLYLSKIKIPIKDYGITSNQS